MERKIPWKFVSSDLHFTLKALLLCQQHKDNDPDMTFETFYNNIMVTSNDSAEMLRNNNEFILPTISRELMELMSLFVINLISDNLELTPLGQQSYYIDSKSNRIYLLDKKLRNWFEKYQMGRFLSTDAFLNLYIYLFVKLFSIPVISQFNNTLKALAMVRAKNEWLLSCGKFTTSYNQLSCTLNTSTYIIDCMSPCLNVYEVQSVRYIESDLITGGQFIVAEFYYQGEEEFQVPSFDKTLCFLDHSGKMFDLHIQHDNPVIILGIFDIGSYESQLHEEVETPFSHPLKDYYLIYVTIGKLRMSQYHYSSSNFDV